jgi:membrane associated rhomboid family serine protease
VAIYLIDESRSNGLKAAGMMSNAAVTAGEWWRTFTAVLLHADAAHLAANVSSGLIVWGLVMGRYGWGVGLLAAYLAGAGGNWAGWLLYGESHRSVGASGMVLGGLGLLAAQAFALWREGPKAYPLIGRGVVGGVLLLVLLGLNPQSDVVAHLGGFLTGLLLGIGIAFVPAGWLREARLNSACGVMLGGWVVLTWWLAL